MRWSSDSWSQVHAPRDRSLQVGIEALLVRFCIHAAAARGRGESGKRGPDSCGWALSTTAPHQRQRLLSAASSRRERTYMSSLELVITIARRVLRQRRGGATAAVPWKEEGEVPAWSDGGGGTETVQDEKSTPKKTQTARNLKRFEYTFSQKRILTRKHRECGEFSELVINRKTGHTETGQKSLGK